MTTPRAEQELQARFSLAALLRDFERYLVLVPDAREKERGTSILRDAKAMLERGLTEDQTDQPQEQLVQFCIQNRLQPILSAHRISYPTYNYYEDFHENASGPWDSVPAEWQAVSPPVYQLLGFEIGFPLGVPASVLTATAGWIEYYARQGYNVLTYKTVRSQEWDAHPQPNWIFLHDLEQPLDPDAAAEPVHGDLSVWPRDRHAFSMANSFGVPSSDPVEWERDVRDALGRLRAHQLLIVSVMGTYEKYTGEDLVDDFVAVAKSAEAAGAPVIELNLSCPNTVDPKSGKVKQSLICESPAVTRAIVSRVRGELAPETKIVIKLSYMEYARLVECLRTLFDTDTRPLIDGVSGINTLQREVIGEGGRSAFVGITSDPETPRRHAGISGVAIREFGLQFVRNLQQIRIEYGLPFDIIGMGGVMRPQDVEQYRLAGADAVQTATAAFWNPRLATEVYNYFGGRPFTAKEIDVRGRILELVAEEPRTLRELVEAVKDLVSPSDMLLARRVRDVLADLEGEGIVVARRDGEQVTFAAEEPLATVEA